MEEGDDRQDFEERQRLECENWRNTYTLPAIAKILAKIIPDHSKKLLQA